MTARDIKTLKRLNIKLTETEVRSEFLKRMVKKKIGLREEEEFLTKEEIKLRGSKLNSKKREEIVTLLMKEKIKDNKKVWGQTEVDEVQH